jgi:hypothetical protein
MSARMIARTTFAVHLVFVVPTRAYAGDGVPSTGFGRKIDLNAVEQDGVVAR